jgi:hypothetical protein
MAGSDRKLELNNELHKLYSSLSIIGLMKSRRIRLAGHVACLLEKEKACWISVGNPEGNRPLGRPRRKWKNNITTDVREI